MDPKDYEIRIGPDNALFASMMIVAFVCAVLMGIGVGIGLLIA